MKEPKNLHHDKANKNTNKKPPPKKLHPTSQTSSLKSNQIYLDKIHLYMNVTSFKHTASYKYVPEPTTQYLHRTFASVSGQKCT